jgi:NADP-dependent alcohol dehydrogenase
VEAKLQDRQAEAILLTLQNVAEGALEMPPNYDSRANLMWTVTNSLNRLIGKGVPTDWATHAIGHELTALFGLAHAESLAVVMPYLLWYKREEKAEKLTQYANRVWGLPGQGEAVIRKGLDKMTAFFEQVHMPTKLTEFGIDPDDAAERIRERFSERGTVLGEHKDITPQDVGAILKMSQ